MFNLFYIFCILQIIDRTQGCGITTHIEISHRAKTYFKDDSGFTVHYAKLIQSHNDALMAGSPYPDAYYDKLCANGVYHDVSEDTHWAPFLNATVNYINTKYPQPWDEATEKLVVFMFGIVSHQVADILWHSLGIDQGFLQVMGNVNFHGSFDNAHSVGDFGGDVLSTYEMNMSYIPVDFHTTGWYIPIEDLYNIYNFFNGTRIHIPKDVISVCSTEIFLERYVPIDDLFNIYLEYYGALRLPKSIIQECSLTLFIGRLAESLGAKELFKDYADKSPFLVDQFEKYYEGGVDDMAGWTNRIWQQTVTMMEKGTQSCSIPKSTLFLNCDPSHRKLGRYRDPGKNGYFTRPPLNGLSHEDVTVEKVLRGIRLKPSETFMRKLKKKLSDSAALKISSQQKLSSRETDIRQQSQQLFPNALLYVQNDYARLGESFTTGDLNFDSIPDLVVSAPGYGTMGSPQEGRVYIIYGTENGIPVSSDLDLDTLELTGQGQILRGWGTAQSRFGTSVAVMDINLDGADDIAIGCPAYADMMAAINPIEYNGYVMIYFGLPKKKIVANGAANITIVCEKAHHCNLGYSLTSGDVNNDGHPDLVIGTPFAPEGGQQRGFVTALFASKNNFGHQYMDVTTLTWKISGDQDNSWFGYDMTFGKWNDQNVVFVSQPEFRSCDFKNCSYSENDIQSVGQVRAFFGTNLTHYWTAHGLSQFSEMGWSADIGSPYPDKTVQVIAASELGATTIGSIFGNEYMFRQAGCVSLYNTTSGSLPSVKTLPPQMLCGDRDYGRYGAKVKFFDVNNDGMSDLLVGAPFRSQDITELFFGADQGEVYIYQGGEDFAAKTSATFTCRQSTVKPCPRLQADYILQWPGLKSHTRFGSNFVFLKSPNSRQVFVTAQHASEYGRLAGAIGAFNF